MPASQAQPRTRWTATSDTLVSTTASSNSTTFSVVPPNAGGSLPPTAGAAATVNTVPSNPAPASSFVASAVVNTGQGSDASNPTNARTQPNTANSPAATRTDAIPPASQTNQTTSNGSNTPIVIGIAAMLTIFLAIVGAVVVRRKKLPATANNKRAHKKRYIGRTDFSNSTEYFADAENGPSRNDTSYDDIDFDAEVSHAPKPIQQQQQHEPQSPDFSWPFATPRTIEETSDDTVVAQRGLISESEDGANPAARDLARKPSFELMQDTTSSAKNASEAFNYFGFGSNRLPTLHPLLPSHSSMTGVQVTSGEFEYANVSLGLPTLDQYAGEACFTDSGETDSAAAQQRDIPSSSNSSIIKHIASSPPIAVISENPLERKVSEKGVI
ncbi:hypothetical protein BJ741DRAFT_601426, partial [Chytriomyces cf. hyalinus JEL632]